MDSGNLVSPLHVQTGGHQHIPPTPPTAAAVATANPELAEGHCTGSRNSRTRKRSAKREFEQGFSKRSLWNRREDAEPACRIGPSGANSTAAPPPLPSPTLQVHDQLAGTATTHLTGWWWWCCVVLVVVVVVVLLLQ